MKSGVKNEKCVKAEVESSWTKQQLELAQNEQEATIVFAQQEDGSLRSHDYWKCRKHENKRARLEFPNRPAHSVFVLSL